MAKVKKSQHDMTLLDHLIELRNRLLVSFCAFLFLFFLCFIKFTNDNQNLADIVYNFLQAPLAAEILVSDIMGEPSPVPRYLQQALAPARFLKRGIIRGRPL